jgi:HTH-type transcriptional regulator, transcriptional repressor of NAD biosynthesis genes
VAEQLKRICLLGAESTGKTTLAGALAEAYGTVWNPEYGRAYTELGREPETPWSSAEFTHIARIQCWYEDCLAGSAQGVLFCDTDAFTTALFHEVYLGESTHAFDELVARRYDLYLVCGLDVPWRHDGIREFDVQRLWMHECYVERARSSGTPWVLLEGPREKRLRESMAAVDRVLR